MTPKGAYDWCFTGRLEEFHVGAAIRSGGPFSGSSAVAGGMVTCAGDVEGAWIA